MHHQGGEELASRVLGPWHSSSRISPGTLASSPARIPALAPPITQLASSAGLAPEAWSSISTHTLLLMVQCCIEPSSQ